MVKLGSSNDACILICVSIVSEDATAGVLDQDREHGCINQGTRPGGFFHPQEETNEILPMTPFLRWDFGAGQPRLPGRPQPGC